MKLHFGGSRPGIDNHLDEYRLIREQIIQLGHAIARDWLGDDRQDLVNMFTENERSISRSDGVILDATYDSHGAGIQLALALMYRRPILLLRKKNTLTSPIDLKIINARDRSLVQWADYANVEEVKVSIAEFTHWIEAHSQLARFNIELDRKLDNYLKLKANVNNTSKSEEIRKLVEDDLNKDSQAPGASK